MEFASQFVAICGVLGLMLGLLWFSRKKGWATAALPAFGVSSSSRRLQSLERLPLSTTHSLHLVRLGERVLLLGVSPAGITVLDQLGNSAPPVLSELDSTKK